MQSQLENQVKLSMWTFIRTVLCSNSLNAESKYEMKMKGPACLIGKLQAPVLPHVHMCCAQKPLKVDPHYLLEQFLGI